MNCDGSFPPLAPFYPLHWAILDETWQVMEGMIADVPLTSIMMDRLWVGSCNRLNYLGHLSQGRCNAMTSCSSLSEDSRARTRLTSVKVGEVGQARKEGGKIHNDIDPAAFKSASN